MNSSEPERPAIRVPSDSIPVSIAVCFFLSGLAGLVYEVVWARQLALFLGITSYAHAAVITAYMAGLAAGSVYFGRQADRHPRPLLVYAWLELGVGAYAALTPWLFPALQAAYTAWVDVGSIGEPSGHAVRFTISLLALLLPTFLMGGTLPLLVKGCTTSLPALGRFTGSLYGINTLGAVSGTLLAGFVLLPAAGVTATIYTGAAVNIAIALFVLFVFHPPETKNAQQPLDRDLAADLPAAARLSVTARIGVPLAFAMAGFAALLTQLAWIRVMILVVGGSVYAFTVTLASFLGGLGLGSLLYARLLTTLSRRRPKLLLRERMALAALLAILTSLGLLLGLPLVAKFPDWFMAAFAAGLKDSFALYQLFIFALSCCLMILPTLLMGALFPLVTTIWTTSGERAGRGIGSVYAMNTAGTILGASLGGVLILPWLGAQDSVRLAASLYLLVAAAFWLMSGAGRGSVFRLCLAGGLAGAVGAIVWLMPPWDRALITSGVFYQSENLQRVMQQQPGRSLEEVLDDYELLFFEEGADATVAVRRMRGEDKQRTLVINGKADASSVGDLPTQVLLAQLPLSINPGAMNILVIGLGSGITAGSLSSSESLRSMTVLEISAEVVEASALFAPENRSVLEDPRVNLVTADARNYLMAAEESFDLIVSEPSNPWISGSANLFTTEFLQLAKSRLRPDGVMTQWFHTYSMSGEDLKTMLKTFDDNFDYVSVWRMQVGDLALIGSDKPHALSLPYVTAQGADELARASVHSARDLSDLFLLGGEALSRYVRDARINSDEAPVIEFNAPKYLYSVTEFENVEDIEAYLRGEQQDLPVTGLARQSAGFLEAPFMGLVIAEQGEPPSMVRARWIVGRAEETSRGTGPASQRLLTWREGAAEYQVRAVFLDEMLRDQGLEDLLALLTQRTGLQGGRLTLADGTPAIWLFNPESDAARPQLDMAWDCSNGRIAASRFALNARLPILVQGEWRKAMDRLATRISCRSTN